MQRLDIRHQTISHHDVILFERHVAKHVGWFIRYFKCLRLNSYSQNLGQRNKFHLQELQSDETDNDLHYLALNMIYNM